MNALEAIAKAIKAYKTDFDSDDVEFADTEINEEGRELYVYIDGTPYAIKAEEI